MSVAIHVFIEDADGHGNLLGGLETRRVQPEVQLPVGGEIAGGDTPIATILERFPVALLVRAPEDPA